MRVGMPREKTEEFPRSVTRSANYCDPNRHRLKHSSLTLLQPKTSYNGAYVQPRSSAGDVDSRQELELLGSRADFWLDAASLAFTLLLPVFLYSVAAVRKGNAGLHRRLQLALSVALLVIVVVLEWHFRMVGWRQSAEASRFFPWGVDVALGIHIAFALATVVGWIAALTVGVRGWSSGQLRVSHRDRHRWWGRFALWSTFGAAFTAWIFYLVAFVM